jgi:hypothetical protein
MLITIAQRRHRVGDRNKRGDTPPLAPGRIHFLALIAGTVAIKMTLDERNTEAAN